MFLDSVVNVKHLYLSNKQEELHVLHLEVSLFTCCVLCFVWGDAISLNVEEQLFQSYYFCAQGFCLPLFSCVYFCLCFPFFHCILPLWYFMWFSTYVNLFFFFSLYYPIYSRDGNNWKSKTVQCMALLKAPNTKRSLIIWELASWSSSLYVKGGHSNITYFTLIFINITYFTLIYFEEWCLQPEAAKKCDPVGCTDTCFHLSITSSFAGRNIHSELN